jgi:hypothetical protein
MACRRVVESPTTYYAASVVSPSTNPAVYNYCGTIALKAELAGIFRRLVDPMAPVVTERRW